MKLFPSLGRSLGWLLAALLSVNPGLAQEGPLSLEFSFSNPGARSMGFGGAFVALADDATAAFANPAGLIQLTRQEVSIEGRHRRQTTEFTEGGRVAGSPSGIGLDTVNGLRFGETSADLDGVSFLSYVYPKKSWALAFYRHQLANFESFSESQGFFADPLGPTRLDDFRRSTELEVVAHAIALAYRVNERLSLGFNVAQFDSDAEIFTERYAPLAVTLPDGTFGRSTYDPRALAESDIVTSTDTSLGFAVGALWRPHERWTLGASFRQGPDLGFRAVEFSGPAFELPIPAGTVTDRDAGDIQLPHVVALGAAYRSASGRFTVAFEWDRVEYTNLVDSLDPDNVDATVDDGNEIHLGVELILPLQTPVVALRAGAWLDPDHRFRFVGDDVLNRAILRGGDDEWHVAFGVGVAFGQVQIDAAVDFSNLVDTASLSAIYSF